MKGIFVVGTDTECGKTIVSAALVAALRRRGLEATYMKPVGSDGVPLDGRLVSPDALFAARAAGLSDPWDLLNPICLPGALSPLAAAEAAGLTVDLDVVQSAWVELSGRREFVVVEGVGGLLVPLTARNLAVDLVTMLRLPVLVVARPRLGTINHTLLTLEALEYRGLTCLGFCYSHQTDQIQDASLPTNARLTRLFTQTPFWGSLPYLTGLSREHPDPEVMARAGEVFGAFLTEPALDQNS